MLRSDPVKLRELVDQALPVPPMSKRRFPGFVNDRIQYGRMGEPDPLPITAPTLVIHGTADRDVGFEQAESTVRRIPHAVLLPVEGAGHLALVTHADLIGRDSWSFSARTRNSRDGLEGGHPVRGVHHITLSA